MSSLKEIVKIFEIDVLKVYCENDYFFVEKIEKLEVLIDSTSNENNEDKSQNNDNDDDESNH